METPQVTVFVNDPLVVGFVSGILVLGGFNTAMEGPTPWNSVFCHEMRDTVHQEYKQTIHYSEPHRRAPCAPTATCPRTDAQNGPQDPGELRKFTVKIMGTIDTPRNSKPSASNLPSTNGPG